MNGPGTPPPKTTKIDYPYSPELFTYTPNSNILSPLSPSPSPSHINNERIEPSQKRFRNIEQENQIKRNYEECIQIKVENTETFKELQNINLKIITLEKKKKELKNKLEYEKSKIIEECEEEKKKFFNNPIFHSPNSPMSSRINSNRSRSSRKRSLNTNNLSSASSPKKQKSKRILRYTLPEQQEIQLNVEAQQNMENPIDNPIDNPKFNNGNGNLVMGNMDNMGNIDDFDFDIEFKKEGRIIGVPINRRNTTINNRKNTSNKKNRTINNTKRRGTI